MSVGPGTMGPMTTEEDSAVEALLPAVADPDGRPYVAGLLLRYLVTLHLFEQGRTCTVGWGGGGRE